MTFDAFSKFHDFPWLFQKMLFFQIFQNLWKPWLELLLQRTDDSYPRYQFGSLGHYEKQHKTKQNKKNANYIDENHLLKYV